jgi:hypothetical protein
VLLAEEEMVLQDMINRLIEIGRCYGIEINVGKINRISREPYPLGIIIDEKNWRMWNVSTLWLAR